MESYGESSLFAPVKSLGCHLLDFRGGHRTEEYPHGLFPADYPDQFMHRAIHADEDEKKDLNGEEMRPDDYREQLLIAGDKAARLPPEIDEAFQIVNDSRYQQVDNGLPGYVVDQRFVREAIDHR